MALPDSISERARQGAQVRREVLGAAYVDAGKQKANPFTQHFIEFTQTQCWGNVWLREGLSRKTRSMLNVCMLAALARWHEFEVHIRGALNNGVTPEEIAEILLHTAVYAGIPIA
jgi:4-carboxymuconolactone decarboxylase